MNSSTTTPNRSPFATTLIALMGVSFMTTSGFAGDITKQYGGKALGLKISAGLDPTHTATNFTESAHVQADLEILGHTSKLVDATASAMIDENKGVETKGTLSLDGYRVADWDKTLTQASLFSIPVVSKTVTLGEDTVVVAGIPIELKVTGSASISVDGALTITPDAKQGQDVKFTCGPKASAGLNASASVKFLIVSAGVEGSLNFGSYGVMGYVQATYPTTNHMAVTYGADLVTTGGSGEIDAFAEVKVKIWFIHIKKKVKVTIFDFKSKTETTPLVTDQLYL